MRCEEAGELLVAHQDGELGPLRARAVQLHLHRCPSCRARERRLRAVTPVPSTWRPARIEDALEELGPRLLAMDLGTGPADLRLVRSEGQAG